MSTSIQSTASGALPFTTSTTQNVTEAVNQTDESAGFSQNRYTPAQESMQNQALGGISGLLSGGSISENFGLPESVRQAAWFDFNKYQAPQLATQYGAGSPAINSAMQELNLKLAGMGGQQAMSNGLNAYRTGLEYAFRETGVDQEKEAEMNRLRTVNTQEDSSGMDWGAALDLALSIAQSPAPTFP